MCTTPCFIIPLTKGSTNHTIAITELVLYCICFIIIVASFIVQFCQTAVYGKFDEHKEKDDNENSPTQTTTNAAEEKPSPPGCRINQRIAHICSDFIPGVILFSNLIFILLYRKEDNITLIKDKTVNIIAASFYIFHYCLRGLVSPLCQEYSSKDVDLGICLGGFFPNCLFSSMLALHIAVTDYDSTSYYTDPRFSIGIILFVFGFALNRWSDWHLASLRKRNNDSQVENSESTDYSGCKNDDDEEEIVSIEINGRRYYYPTKFMFSLCYCPAYLGEFFQWLGFAILTSSLAGVLWMLFGLSTFLPRSLATKQWYIAKFGDIADPNKAALIPWMI